MILCNFICTLWIVFKKTFKTTHCCDVATENDKFLNLTYSTFWNSGFHRKMLFYNSINIEVDQSNFWLLCLTSESSWKFIHSFGMKDFWLKWKQTKIISHRNLTFYILWKQFMENWLNYSMILICWATSRVLELIKLQSRWKEEKGSVIQLEVKNIIMNVTSNLKRLMHLHVKNRLRKRIYGFPRPITSKFNLQQFKDFHFSLHFSSPKWTSRCYAAAIYNFPSGALRILFIIYSEFCLLVYISVRFITFNLYVWGFSM